MRFKAFGLPVLLWFLIAIGSALLYGFLMGGTPHLVFMALLFAVFFITTAVFALKDKDKWLRKTIISITAAFLGVLLFVGAYMTINQLGGTPVDEYSALVENVNYEGGGRIYFENPQGESMNAQIHDYRIIVVDNDTLIRAGDRVRIQEIEGLFGVHYCVIMDEPEDNKS